jgi:hypothetical protein
MPEFFNLRQATYIWVCLSLFSGDLFVTSHCVIMTLLIQQIFLNLNEPRDKYSNVNGNKWCRYTNIRLMNMLLNFKGITVLQNSVSRLKIHHALIKCLNSVPRTVKIIKRILNN